MAGIENFNFKTNLILSFDEICTMLYMLHPDFNSLDKFQVVSLHFLGTSQKY